jgi:tRNA (mo5U34)-methyltransferase
MALHPKLADRTCYHLYEVEPGLYTPGQQLRVNPALVLDELGLPQDLTGLRALDVGAWDGPLTFELERRGAEVAALDIHDPDITVFNAVKAIKRSAARYVQASIYDALPEVLGVFDIVLFVGVYYHLRSPSLALERIRKLISDDGTLYIEGASGTNHLAKELGLAPEMVDRLPLAYLDIDKKIYGYSSWWYPTTAGLEATLRDSGFFDPVLSLRTNTLYAHPRIIGHAQTNPEKHEPGAMRVLSRDYRSDQLKLSWKLRGRARRLLDAVGLLPVARQIRDKARAAMK